MKKLEKYKISIYCGNVFKSTIYAVSFAFSCVVLIKIIKFFLLLFLFLFYYIDMLEEKDKILLLKIARKSIENYFSIGKEYVPELQGKIAEPGRAFVTLKEYGNLRGCIGYVEPIYPLGLTVSKAAVAAAFSDPRFPPLSRDELESIDIEISVLTEPREINNPEEVEVGKHGIIIEKGLQRGLLLPQVPVEYGWGLEEFLTNGCLKAGLDPNCWRRDAKIYVFEAEVFSERDFLKKDAYNKNK